MKFIGKREVLGSAPAPDLVLYWYEVDGRLECLRVDVVAKRSPPAPVTTSMMRRIPWQSIMESNKRGFASFYKRRKDFTRGWRGSEIREEALRVLPIAEASIGRRPRRARQYGPEHYAEVAAIYSAAWRSGSPAPTKAVADAKHVSRSTAAKWVSHARNNLGLLPKTEKRVARALKRPRKGKG